MNDTDKLNLIQEHALEYYDDAVRYEFIEGGFFTYSLPSEKAICYIDMFISKSHRGSRAFQNLIGACKLKAIEHDVDTGYGTIEKGSQYEKVMQTLLTEQGFVYASEDDETTYYVWKAS